MSTNRRITIGILVLGLAAAALYADVTELGPAPIHTGDYTGRIAALACSPTDPNMYFAAGADAGVWRTYDGGASWTPVTDGMPTSAMGALAMDPTDHDIVYAGTGEANYANHSRYGVGLYKTTDAGDTWTLLGADVFAGRCFSKLKVDPQHPQTIYAAITRAGGFPELAAAKNHPQATGPLGVFRSTDGGVSWTHLTNGLPSLSATDLALDPGNPQVLYAAIGRIFGHPDNGLYKTTDGGDSWRKLTGGGWPTSTLGRIAVAVAPSQPQRVYTLITNPASATGGNATTLDAYRSDDGGTTWTPLSIGSIQSTYGWFLSVITVDPTDADTVFMGGLNLYRSTTAGQYWSNASPPHVDQHALAWDAAGRLLAGDDGGVHRSSSLGSGWTALNDGFGAIQFYAGLSTHPTNDRLILGGTQDNGSNIRLPSLVWVQLFGGDGGWTQIDQFTPNRLFVEYQGSGNLFVTNNGGGSFVYSGTGIVGGDRNCFLPPYLIDPTNSARMLYATHRIYLSSNGGASWTPISGDLTGGANAAVRTLALAPSDPSIVYAATNDGRVLRSDDAGYTFDLVLDGVLGWPRTTRELFVHPDDPNTVYLGVGAFGTDQVRRTFDGGQTWEILDGNLPDVPVNTVTVDVRSDPPVIYAGADDGLYRSLDDGATWGRYGFGLPRTAFIDLVIEPARGRLVAATQGRGAWLVPLACVGDANCDGAVNWRDIDFFVAAQNDNRAAWEALFDAAPTCPFANNDTNGDGYINWRDIDPFVALMNTTCP